MSLHVFGHKNPDTDAIVAAIGLAEWLQQQGIGAAPYRLGPINQETHYLLGQAHQTPPPLLESLAADSEVALVDHNESQQSIADLASLQIRYVVDHHKLGDLTTREPAFIYLLPVGSTSTMLYGMFIQSKLTIGPKLAQLMLGAIISDTLHLNSPTTTPADRDALRALAKIASITDTKAFAQGLFEAKSDISGASALDLVTADYKQFRFGSTLTHWGIASIETVNPKAVIARLGELKDAIATVKQRDGLDYLLVVIVDILQQQSWAIATDQDQDQVIAQAFGTQVQDGQLALGNLVSRKKQFVPTLESHYHKQG